MAQRIFFGDVTANRNRLLIVQTSNPIWLNVTADDDNKWGSSYSFIQFKTFHFTPYFYYVVPNDNAVFKIASLSILFARLLDFLIKNTGTSEGYIIATHKNCKETKLRWQTETTLDSKQIWEIPVSTGFNKAFFHEYSVDRTLHVVVFANLSGAIHFGWFCEL